MHWIIENSDNDSSVEFQRDLSKLFPNTNLNEVNASFKNSGDDELIEENRYYQTLLIENNVYRNSYRDKNNRYSEDNEYSNVKQTNLLKYNFTVDKKIKCESMSNYGSENEQISDLTGMGVNTLSLKPIEKPKILISPDKTISLVNKVCPYCKNVGGHYHDVYEKQLRNENGMKEKYRVTLYKCPNCENKYGPYTYKKINNELKDKINLDERIRECYANTGLSYDKIAKMVGTFYDIHVSHQYVKKVIEQAIEGFQETQELVILPDDYKINGKTSKKRKVTDTAMIYMFKRNDIDYSGDITVDEVFLTMMKNRQYLVAIMDNTISDMPIALAIIPTRKFEVMKAVFNFVFENDQLKSLTSDLFSVYDKIAEEYDIPRQGCVFHSMYYVGDIIYKELKKKDKYNSHEKIWIKSLLTEYREILRDLNYGDAVDKLENFLGKLGDLPDFFETIGKHLRKHFAKLFTHLHYDGVLRTSNKCETFNSLPQIRRIKKISKTPWGLLHRLACTVKYYLPNLRTLQNRGDWHILPQ